MRTRILRSYGLALCLLLPLSVTPAQASKEAGLPKGICPFDPKLIPKNFTKAIRRDYGREGIEFPFHRREKWYGPCESARKSGKDRFLLRYKDAEIPLSLEWRKRQIEQFQFGPVRHLNDSWSAFTGFLKRHWPASALYVRLPGKDGTEITYRDRDYLNIGEGRNLLLVAALEEKIREGALQNQTVVELREQDKVQDIDDLAEEPAGSGHSLSDLKDRVFNRFDRTAADLILRAVGFGALEEGRDPAVPFLSRREFAWLMTLPKEKMAALQRSQARQAARDLDLSPEMPPLPMERYDHLKIEWRGSARELCEALTAIASVPELYDGLASRNFRAAYPGWKSGVYHAARDFGLAQTTWAATLPGFSGPVCFSLLLNEAAFLDEEAVEEIHSRAIRILTGTKKPAEVKGNRPEGR